MLSFKFADVCWGPAVNMQLRRFSPYSHCSLCTFRSKMQLQHNPIVDQQFGPGTFSAMAILHYYRDYKLVKDVDILCTHLIADKGGVYKEVCPTGCRRGCGNIQ